MSKVKIGNVFPPLAWLLQRCAPAGHGYGETMRYVYGSESELETIFSKIIATMENETTKQISFACGDGTLYGRGRFKATIFRHESGYAYICAATYGNYAVMKTLSGGTWYPVEWVNPPMMVGVEYRTTERYMGKPVYAALVNVGAFPEEGTRIASTGITATGVIRFSAAFDYASLPIPGFMEIYTHHDGEEITVKLQTVSERVYSGDTYVSLYYIKD